MTSDNLKDLMREDEKYLNVINQKVICRFIVKELTEIGDHIEKKYPKNEFLMQIKKSLLEGPDEDFIKDSRDKFLGILKEKFRIEEDEREIENLLEQITRKIFNILAQEDKLLDRNTTPHKREVNKTKMEELIYNSIGKQLRDYIEVENESEDEDEDKQSEAEDTEIDFNSDLSEDDEHSEDEDERSENERSENERSENERNEEKHQEGGKKEEVLTIKEEEEEPEPKKNDEFILADNVMVGKEQFSEDDIRSFKEFQKFLGLQKKIGGSIEFEEYLKQVLETIKPKRKRRAPQQKKVVEEEESEEPSIFDAPMARKGRLRN